MNESMRLGGMFFAQPLFVCEGPIRRWSPEERVQLKNFFLEQQLPIAEIACKLGRTPASINTAISILGLPRQRWVRRFRMPTDMTPALARVHAHVCGDGHLFSKRERDDYGYLKEYKRGSYRIRYGFAYTNLNPKLIHSFTEDVRESLGLNSRYDHKSWTVYVKSKEAWLLLKQWGAGKSREWFIPSEILQGPEPVRKAWLQALFDDEAHFAPEGRIRLRSVNRSGIEQAASMLKEFLPCHITPLRGLYPDGSCYLVVLKSAQERFLRVVGSLKFNFQESAPRVLQV